MALALARGRGRVRDVKVELHSRKTNKNLPRKDRKGTLVRVSYRGIRRFRNIVSEERVPCDPSRHSQRCICGPIGGKGWRPLVSLLGNASNAAGAPSTFPPAGWATHSLGEVIVLLVQDWREPRLRQHEEDHHDSRTPRVPDFDPAWKSAFFPPLPPSSHRLGKKKIVQNSFKIRIDSQRCRSPAAGVRRRSMAAFPSAAGASRRALVIFVTLLLTGTHSPHEQQDQRVVLTTTKSAVSQNG